MIVIFRVDNEGLCSEEGSILAGVTVFSELRVGELLESSVTEVKRTSNFEFITLEEVETSSFRKEKVLR